MSSTNAPAFVAASSDALPEEATPLEASAVEVSAAGTTGGGGGEPGEPEPATAAAVAKVEPLRAAAQAVGALAASTGSVDTDAPINCLPGEVLAIVFCHLDSKTLLIAVPAVCRQW